MDKSAIEYKALTLLEALGAPGARPSPAARQALTEARAQVHLGLPPAAKAGRELAAQANTARGQALLWLIREKAAPKGRKPGSPLSRAALETWLDELRASFEGIPPQIEFLDLAGPDGERLAALHIETDRAPFVVFQARAAKGKERQTEVLWQEDGLVRPIRRAELVRLVTPLRELPEFEILQGELSFYKNANRKVDPRNAYLWSLDATVYVAPRDEKRWILPFRRAGVVLESAASAFSAEARQVNLSADREGTGITESDSALLVHGVGQFYLFASGGTSREDPPLASALRLTFSLTPTGSSNAAVCAAGLAVVPPKEDHQAGLWRLV
jgi:hypothetical protein